MDETASMIKTSFENGLVSLKSTDAEIQKVVGSVSTYTTLTGEDATAATRAVSQMLRNNLAPNAEAAFDILTRGQQLGINKAEDLLDTFNEYGTQFRKLGLDATDSLGLMNQLIRGGARDSDVAADAIKEFSIRAIDGSKTTAAGFKALGLDAGKMAAEIGKGGPAARTAFGDILDGLNQITDPVKRNQAGVALFGTQWEDLGGAIKNADLDTAAASLGQVAGATDKANAALSATPAAKLQKTMRTLQQVFVDAIGKYIVPQLDKFASWFNGPGKFILTGWAIDAADAILAFADTTLRGLESVTGGLAKYGAVAALAAAGTVALTNPTLAASLVQRANDLKNLGSSAETGIGKAREQIAGLRGELAKTKTKVKVEADIADLETKISTAKTKLQDKTLTAPVRAKLEANIYSWQQNLAKAKRGVEDPALVKQRIAKLTADKTSLDTKIRQAKSALGDSKLTATKKAKLQAEIGQLLAAKQQAQSAIDSLRGKTVTLTFFQKVIGQKPPQDIGVRLPGRASGGPVVAGRQYLVGERGPEILTMGGASGNITPNSALGGTTIIENHIEIGGEVVRVVRSEIKQDQRNLKRTVSAGVR
nr:phage tail tape measure protein [Kribbella italica]